MKKIMLNSTDALLIECVSNQLDYRLRIPIGSKEIVNIFGEDEVINLMYEFAEYELKYLPTLNEIKDIVISFYNKECDKEILSGLKFEGATVWLSSENQFNYKSAFDFAIQTGGANLPVRIKLGEDSAPVYKEFTTVEDFQEFIVLLFSHVNTTLNKYWDIKDNIDWEKYKLD